MDDEARSMVEKSGIPVAGEIPFDPGLRSARDSGSTWISARGTGGEQARMALRAVKGVLDTMQNSGRGTAKKNRKERT